MKSKAMKQLILCADDYGLNASVSQGIIDLLQHQRLSAASCLTTSAHWLEQAAWLKPFQGKGVSIGLHFNLTEGQPLSPAYIQAYGLAFFPLSHLIIKAFLRRLDMTILEQECQAQLDRFVSGLGVLPDFIDGHQHIHQLPQVREALLRVYERSLRSHKTYLRSTQKMVLSPGWGGRIKQALIFICGSIGFRRLLNEQAIPSNPSFAGIYDFSQAAQYARILPYFLKKIGERGLIMCHPGLDQNDPLDVISAARFQEYTYLASEQFIKDCQALNVRLSPFQF